MNAIYVIFCDKKLESSFESLKQGRSEDKRLHHSIEKAIEDLKKDPTSGTKIQKRLWPKEYILKHGLTNLWKYDLPDGWRLIYTIKSDDVMTLNVILEWFNHKGYERRFGY
ncbi:MAG: type II toxin-antitoxin system RelE/ParE family toxin [Nanoarchaeota archaeon]|nr:type II toxin-antitoxin system RelE/ParE family toxin [Nanoarchaeota archaeon]